MENERHHRRLVGDRRGAIPWLVVSGVVAGACVGQPGYPPEGADATASASGASTTSSPPMTSAPTSTLDPSATSSDPDVTASAEGSSTTTGPEMGPFEFARAPLDRYTQVDRVGFPLINTLLNILGDKDGYNAAMPMDDANLTFYTNIRESLETLHLGAPGMQTADNTGLDDDFIANGFIPCIPPPLPMNNCDDQIGPFAIPDKLTLDLDDPPVFPNGRPVADPVADIILAVVLLDLEAHDVTALLDLDQDGTIGPSANPIMNDVELPGEFPYLAPAHE